MTNVMTDQQFRELEARQREARDLAGRMGLSMADRERLADLSDDALVACQGELRVEEAGWQACERHVGLLQHRRRTLATLDELVGLRDEVGFSTQGPDVEMVGRLVERHDVWAAANDERFHAAVRASVEFPAPEGFEHGVQASQFAARARAAVTERLTLKKELDARVVEREMAMGRSAA